MPQAVVGTRSLRTGLLRGQSVDKLLTDLGIHCFEPGVVREEKRTHQLGLEAQFSVMEEEKRSLARYLPYMLRVRSLLDFSAMICIGLGALAIPLALANKIYEIKLLKSLPLWQTAFFAILYAIVLCLIHSQVTQLWQQYTRSRQQWMFDQVAKGITPVIWKTLSLNEFEMLTSVPEIPVEGRELITKVRRSFPDARFFVDVAFPDSDRVNTLLDKSWRTIIDPWVFVVLPCAEGRLKRYIYHF